MKSTTLMGNATDNLTNKRTFFNRNGEATHVNRQYNSQMADIFHRKKQLLILPVVVKRFFDCVCMTVFYDPTVAVSDTPEGPPII